MNRETKPEGVKPYLKEAFFILTLAAILCFCVVFFLTRPALFKDFDFSNQGQVGDTIGGLTAPIINLFAAILVYISFREQNRANRIQQDALATEKDRNNNQEELNHIESLYSELQKYIDNLNIRFIGYDQKLKRVTSETIILNGSQALVDLILVFRGKKLGKIIDTKTLTEMDLNRMVLSTTFIVDTTEIMLDALERNNSFGKDLLFKKLSNYYKYLLLPYLDSFTYFVTDNPDDFYADHSYLTDKIKNKIFKAFDYQSSIIKN